MARGHRREPRPVCVLPIVLLLLSLHCAFISFCLVPSPSSISFRGLPFSFHETFRFLPMHSSSDAMVWTKTARIRDDMGIGLQKCKKECKYGSILDSPCNSHSLHISKRPSDAILHAGCSSQCHYYSSTPFTFLNFGPLSVFTR